MILNEGQKRVVGMLRGGKSFLVTGAAGTGKTVVRDVIAAKVPSVVLGPTGMSVSNSAGMTVARYLRATRKTSRDVRRLAASMTVPPNVPHFTVIIEEASMVGTADWLALDLGLRKHLRVQRPFGGVRVVLFGDFCQLSGPGVTCPLCATAPRFPPPAGRFPAAHRAGIPPGSPCARRKRRNSAGFALKSPAGRETRAVSERTGASRLPPDFVEERRNRRPRRKSAKKLPRVGCGCHRQRFQGRISSNQQIQIALDFPQHRNWVMQYRQWWAQGIKGWARRQPADATLNFLVELGPPAYAITGPDQRELSDRWREGLQIRDWVEAIWSDTGNGIA